MSKKSQSTVTTIVVTENSLRQLVRELFDNDQWPAIVTEVPADFAPVSPNALIGDDMKQETLPIEPTKPPHDSVELRASTSNLLKHVPDDKAAQVYDKVKSAVAGVLKNHEDEEMNKKQKTMNRVSNTPASNAVEEALRAQIRTIIKETVPITKLPPGEGPTQQNVKDIASLRKRFANMANDDEEKERFVRKAQTAVNLGSDSDKDEEGNRVKLGGEFSAIGQEFGLAPSSAKRAYREAMMKAQDIGEMTKTPEGRKMFDSLLTQAVEDYVDYLASSGELSSEEIAELKMNPEALLGMREDPETGEWTPLDGNQGSDDFREYLDKAITKARKAHHGVAGWKNRYKDLDLNDK